MTTCKEIFELHGYRVRKAELLNAFREVATDDRDESWYNRTPLHLACEFADAEAVRILLERGAEVNAKDNKGLTPLCVLALLYRNPGFDENAICTIAELLLEYGARVDRSGRDTNALLEAVRNSHHAMVAAIINSGARLDSTDMNGENALHIACYVAGRVATGITRLEQTIAGFDEDRWHSDKEKERLRHELEELREEEARCNETAKRLLQSGQLDPEDKSNSGKTVFEVAMEYGARWVGALLSGRDPETDELAALMGGLDIFQALSCKDMKALDALLRSGVALQTVCEESKMHDFYGNSPLACALLWNNTEAAEMMLRAGADPNYKSPDEQTAFAVWIGKNRETSGEKNGCLPMLQLMIQCGWQPEQAVDKEGNTALSLACRRAGTELGCAAIRYLVGIGADVNARNQQGQTPIMNLYGGCFWDGRIPLYPGLPRGYPYEGRTCSEEDAEILEFLLEAGAGVDTTDQWGNTVLHYIAGSTGNTAAKKAVGILFDFGCPDIGAVNNEGKTAIDIAAGKNDEALVNYLLKYV
ncbi:MAG: ankyrin repeat domain-containing protein [Parabacteroides sp.]|nr:ankyrin repeat domain-containing protein [Parabacteroides sp.]